MKDNNIKKIIGKKVAQMAIGITRTEINSTCPMIAYQPKLPDSARKLKKH